MKKEPQFKNEKDREVALNCYLTTDRAKELLRIALYVALPIMKAQSPHSSREINARKRMVYKDMKKVLSAINEWYRETPDATESLMDTLKEKYPDIKKWNI